MLNIAEEEFKKPGSSPVLYVGLVCRRPHCGAGYCSFHYDATTRTQSRRNAKVGANDNWAWSGLGLRDPGQQKRSGIGNMREKKTPSAARWRDGEEGV